MNIFSIMSLKNINSVFFVTVLLISTTLASDFTPGRVLAQPNPTADKGIVSKILRAAGANEVGQIRQLGILVLQVPAKAELKVASALSKNPNFKFAEPDYVAKAILTPNDPYYATSQWHLPKINAPLAWDRSTGASSVVVSVIDSGVDSQHPDLQGRVLAGYDFINSDADPSDDNGHGTAVAGTAAAWGNNGIGVAGVAWGVSILPVKALDASGSGSYSTIANSITYSADRGARIINLSLGGTSSSRTLQSAVDYAWGKGSVLVAAAGNNGNNVAVYPAACNNVLAVSALDKADARTSWSNYGSYVDLSAPGEGIVTTWSGGGYVSISGTSFSSPIVAGVGALALSDNASLSNADLVDLLQNTADDIGATGYDVYFGWGRVNAARAVAASIPLTDVPLVDTSAPVTSITSPKDGANISKAKSVKISIYSSDNVKVSKTELYINGRLMTTSTTDSFTYSWSTNRLARGTYQLQSKAYDEGGNVGSSAVVSVYR